MSSTSGNTKGGSGASSSSSKRDVAGTSKSTDMRKSSSESESSAAYRENPKSSKNTRGLNFGLEIPPHLMTTSIVRRAKAKAVDKIAPSLMAPVTTNTSVSAELKRRIRSEYFRILHQKRIRLKEDGKLAWMRNFNGTEGNSTV